MTWVSNKCTLLPNEPFSWQSLRKLKKKNPINLTFSVAPSYTTYKDEEESKCSCAHCGWSVQLRGADGGAAGTRTGMLLLSSVCLSWPASWWKGADTKSETAAPPGPASGLRINPQGPGMSIMPCGFHLCQWFLTPSGPPSLFVYAALGNWWRSDKSWRWLQAQIRESFKTGRWSLKLNEKFHPPPGKRCSIKYKFYTIKLHIVNCEISGW